LLSGRLRGLRFDPAYGVGSFVEETVRAAHTGPDVIASFHAVGLAIEDGFGLATQEEIGFLEGMVVDIALAGMERWAMCFASASILMINRLEQRWIRFVRRRQPMCRRYYEELVRRGYKFPLREELLAATQGELRVAGDCATLLVKHGYVKDWPGALATIRDAGYREVKADMAETVETVHRERQVVGLSYIEAGPLPQPP
jgi:hypothetical protein